MNCRACNSTRYRVRWGLVDKARLYLRAPRACADCGFRSDVAGGRADGWLNLLTGIISLVPFGWELFMSESWAGRVIPFLAALFSINLIAKGMRLLREARENEARAFSLRLNKPTDSAGTR